MKVSVIIPTYNGVKKIEKCLKSLEDQTINHQKNNTLQSFETIVVIDGSTDDTEVFLKNSKFNLDLKTISQQNKGRSCSRNAGVRLANGDLLIFIDDDMYLEKDTLEKHLQFHQELDINNGAILVGNIFEQHQETEIQKYKGFLVKKWLAPFKNSLEPMPANNFFLTTQNLSLLKKTFWELNGFDEALTDAEDYDLGKKAVENHIPIYFRYKITAWHSDPITCKSYIKRLLQYQKAHQQLKKLYPDRYAQNQYQATTIKPWKKMIYKFFKNNFWIEVIDKYNFLRFLPKQIKYKMYDIIITANIL
jgi:glycosyltransferase involved in cell wall biosynthesis